MKPGALLLFPGAGADRNQRTLVALDSALRELEKESPALARVVELRFFGGLTETEIGAALDRSERSVRRDWRKARAFLQVELDRLGYPA